MKLNILLVENDARLCRQLSLLLQEHGHEVVSFNSPAALLQDGRALNAHVAFVDRRLEQDDNPEDRSGEQVALDLAARHIPVVLLSGWLPANQAIFEMVRAGTLAGVIDKATPMEEVIACINRFEPGQPFPNGLARFQWLEGDGQAETASVWQSLLQRLDCPQGSAQELAVLFRRLISPCATHVQVKLVPAGHGGTAIVEAHVWTGDGEVEEKLAIKYGDKRLTWDEALRYDRYVGPLPDGVAAQLRWRAETEHLGALAYSWVGDGIEDGAAIKKVDSCARRREAIDRLFHVGLEPWYKVYRTREDNAGQPRSLLEHYTGKDGLWSSHQDLERLGLPEVAADPRLAIEVKGDRWHFGPYGDLPDPVQWAKRGAGSWLTYTRHIPCHGDLHVRNLFVMPDASPRLIDFGRTSLGHVYRDFAALEASLRLTCIEEPDINHLKAMEDLLCNVSNLSQSIEHRYIAASTKEHAADLRCVIQLATDIRRAAADACGAQGGRLDTAEYLFAVVIHMLKYAAKVADEVSGNEDPRQPTRIWHALYAAAKAAETADRCIIQAG